MGFVGVESGVPLSKGKRPRGGGFERLLVWVCVALAIGPWVLGDREPAFRQAVTELSGEALFELGLEAGARGARGEVSGPAIPVEVVQDGGPTWVLEAFDEALRDDGAFVRGEGRALLRVEYVGASDFAALQVHLWRRGWELRLPLPRVRMLRPLAPIGLLVLGLVLGLRGASLSTLSLVAGALAQGLAGSMAAEGIPGPAGFAARFADAPLGFWVVRFARSLDAYGDAWVVGMFSCAVVLVLLDHRRSRRASRADSVSGLRGSEFVWRCLGVVGGLAWVEAALHLGLSAFWATPWGAVSWAGVVALVALLVRRRWFLQDPTPCVDRLTDGDGCPRVASV